eukprot:2370432-Pleurochrysis_carterae.AAC.1
MIWQTSPTRPCPLLSQPTCCPAILAHTAVLAQAALALATPPRPHRAAAAARALFAAPTRIEAAPPPRLPLLLRHNLPHLAVAPARARSDVEGLGVRLRLCSGLQRRPLAAHLILKQLEPAVLKQLLALSAH